MWLLNDFDGVVGNTSTRQYMFSQHLCTIYKAPFPFKNESEFLEAWFDPYDEFYPDLVKQSWDEISSLVHAEFNKFMKTNPASIMPGMREVLTSLKEQHHLGLVTGNRIDNILHTLEQGRVKNLFSIMQGYEDGMQPKPHPEIILTAIERNKIDNSNAHYIGDQVSDAEAAKAAGIGITLVTFGWGSYKKFKEAGFGNVPIAHKPGDLIKMFNKNDCLGHL